MIDVVTHHLRDVKMQVNLLGTEIKQAETNVAIDRIGKLVSKLEALRYALFQQKPSGTP